MAKDCGDCGMCCKLMGVHALAKAPHRWCGHYQRGTGCGVYETRPGECRAFVCYWLRIDALGPEWRPDRARFVMHLTDEGNTLEIEVDMSHPQAWKREPYYSQFKAWAVSGVQRGLTLKVWIGRRCIVVGPAGETDLGLLRPSL